MCRRSKDIHSGPGSKRSFVARWRDEGSHHCWASARLDHSCQPARCRCTLFHADTRARSRHLGEVMLKHEAMLGNLSRADLDTYRDALKQASFHEVELIEAGKRDLRRLA